MLTNTISLQYRILVAQLQRTVKKQAHQLQSLASELQVLKADLLEAGDRCADESASDAGTGMPSGHDSDSRDDWSRANAIAISTTLFSELAVSSGVVDAAPIPISPTTISSTTGSAASAVVDSTISLRLPVPLPHTTVQAQSQMNTAAASGSTSIRDAPASNARRLCCVRCGRKLRRETVWIDEPAEDEDLI